MATPLRRLLQSGRRQDLPRELIRRANIDQRQPESHSALHVLAVRAHTLEWSMDSVRRGLDCGLVLGQLPPLGGPLHTTPVHQTRVLMPVVHQLPVGIGGEPIVVVAIQYNCVVIGDARVTHQLLERVPADYVAAQLVHQLGFPVPADSARDVSLIVGGRVHVHLDQLDPGVVEVIGDPGGRDQYLWSRVTTLGNLWDYGLCGWHCVLRLVGALRGRAQ